MVEEIKYIKILEKEMDQNRDKIYNFLMELDRERRTLFQKDYTNEEYIKICKQIVEDTLFAIFAIHMDKIIGINGFTKGSRAPIFRVFPTIWGYTVVAREYQGRGIGSKLVNENEVYLSRRWAFNIGEVKKENAPMIHILRKSGWKIATEDESNVYIFKPCRRELNLIASLFSIAWRVYLKINVRRPRRV